jgi:hypothetical protein
LWGSQLRTDGNRPWNEVQPTAGGNAFDILSDPDAVACGTPIPPDLKNVIVVANQFPYGRDPTIPAQDLYGINIRERGTLSIPTGTLNPNLPPRITVDGQTISWIGGPTVTCRGTINDVFVVGVDNSLYWRAVNAPAGTPGSSWTQIRAPPLPIQITSAPDAISWGPNRIDVFVTGSDRQLWHIWSDDRGANWRDWERGPPITSSPGRPAPVQITSGPTVTSFAPNRLDIFVKGNNNQYYHTWCQPCSGSQQHDMGANWRILYIRSRCSFI